MLLFQIIYTILICSGLGYLLITNLNFQIKNLFALIVTSLGVGISLYVIIGAIFDIFSIPISWISYSLLTIILYCFMYFFKKNILLHSLKKTKKKSNFFEIIVILIFIIHLTIFVQASFEQPYLENDDPWTVATNSYIISEHSTYDSQTTNYKDGRSEPYAQGYHILLGTFDQLSKNIPQTLKFFNSLFASLSILFIYLFVNKIFKSKLAGLSSSIILAANPSFLSRFIWAEALAISLLILLLFLYSHKKSTSQIILSGIVYASISMIHQRTFVAATILSIVYFISVLIPLIKTKNIKRIVFNKVSLSVIVAFFISLIYWGHQMIKFGVTGIIHSRGLSSLHAQWSRAIIEPSSYFITKTANDMANPSGIGWVIIIITFVGLIFWFKNNTINLETKIVIPLLLFTYVFMHQSGHFMTSIIPIITIWKLIAIPTAVLAGYGIYRLSTLLKPSHFIVFGLIFIILLHFNAIVPKHTVTTSMWPPGMNWPLGFDTVEGYLELQRNEPNAKAFTTHTSTKVIGLGMRTDLINQQRQELQKNIYTTDITQTYQFLNANNYEYLIVDISSIAKAKNQTQEIQKIETFLTQIQNSQFFQPTFNTQSTFVYKIN